MKPPRTVLRMHMALWIGLAVMMMVAASLPGVWSWPARVAFAWHLGVAVFLLVTLVLILKARTITDIRANAATMDQAGRAVIPLSILAGVASVGVIVLNAASRGKPSAFDALVTVITLAVSWLFVQVIFALHYAHEYYSQKPDGSGDRGGMAFAGGEDPDYLDFFYFATIIGMANESADVPLNTKRMRRLSNVHSLIAWLFNTVILALAINLAVNLL